MSSYYDSVTVSCSQQKEQAFSLTNMLYSAGAWLSNRSGMYKGRAYTIYLNKSNENSSLSQSGVVSSETKSYSQKQKLIASIGRCLKAIAGHFNKKIKTQHLLAQELSKEFPNLNLVHQYKADILGRVSSLPRNPVNGEGVVECGTAIAIGLCCIIVSSGTLLTCFGRQAGVDCCN